MGWRQQRGDIAHDSTRRAHGSSRQRDSSERDNDNSSSNDNTCSTFCLYNFRGTKNKQAIATDINTRTTTTTMPPTPTTTATTNSAKSKVPEAKTLAERNSSQALPDVPNDVAQEVLSH